MRRFLPKSLIGQIALVMAAALLVAQAINFGLIFNERQRGDPRADRGAGDRPLRRCFAQRRRADAAGARAPACCRARPARPLLDRRREHRPGRRQRRRGSPARLRDSAEANGLALRDARAAVSDEVALPRRCASR